MCICLITWVNVYIVYQVSGSWGSEVFYPPPPFLLFVFVFSKLPTKITYCFCITKKGERVFCLPALQKKFKAALRLIRAGLGVKAEFWQVMC